MKNFLFRRIFIQREALPYPLTARIMARTQAPYEIIDDPRVIKEELASSSDPIGEGKRILYLTVQKGKFVKPCPCSPGVISCGYLIINSVLGCPFDCSYCILQAYLADPWITLFVNEEQLEKSLQPLFKDSIPPGLRIGPGELSDSLALETLTDQAQRLSQLFYRSSKAILELKTKSIQIEPWLNWPPSPQIVFAWSLNAESIAKEEERGVPSVSERIRAASLLAQKGYHLGFHFDPLVYFEKWEQEYEQVIRELLQQIPARLIRWISLGCLRYPADFKKIIFARFRNRAIFAQEMVPGRDGKFRYFKPLRLKIYSRIYEMLRAYGGEAIPVYLCMEDAEVWEKIIKKKPEGKKDALHLFAPPAID